jgi:hypothetical protein
METMQAERPVSVEESAKKEALVREILGRIADKWTLLVIDALESEGEMRFSRLREQIGGVSQKMLTKTPSAASGSGSKPTWTTWSAPGGRMTGKNTLRESDLSDAAIPAPHLRQHA